MDVPSRLYGTIEEGQTSPVLTIALTAAAADDWDLTINDAAPKPFKVQTFAPDRHWYWQGKIVLARHAGQTTPKPALLHCVLTVADGTHTEVMLLGADVYYLAGGASFAPTTAAPVGPWWVLADESGQTMRAATGGELALAFAASVGRTGAVRRPVMVIVQQMPKALLESCAKQTVPARPVALGQAVVSMDANAGAGSDPACPACRGLVWWHGEWEAEQENAAPEVQWAPEILLRPPFAKSGTAPEGLRARYARQLAEQVLKPWWLALAQMPTGFDKSTRVFKRNPDWTYQSALRLVVVQLPPASREPVDAAAFQQFRATQAGTRTEFIDPVSTWSAIRYAQFDVVWQLQALRLVEGNFVSPTGRDAPPYNLLAGEKSLPSVVLCSLPASGDVAATAKSLAGAVATDVGFSLLIIDQTAAVIRLLGVSPPKEPKGALQIASDGTAVKPLEGVKSVGKDLVIPIPKTVHAAPSLTTVRTVPADNPPIGPVRDDDASPAAPDGSPVAFDIPITSP